MDEHTNTVKALGDLMSVAILAGTVMDEMPKVAALFTVLWYIFRFIEKFRGSPGRCRDCGARLRGHCHDGNEG